MIAPYLAFSSVNLFRPRNTSQFKLIKYHNSIRLKNFLINTSVPVTLVGDMLTFRDTNKSFKVDGDLLKTMTKYKFNFDHSNPQDPKLIYEFGKEMKFNVKQVGRKILRMNLL